MTDKQRAEERRFATLQRKREWAQLKKVEREYTITALREIRDSAEATPGERLKAIEMLSKLIPTY